MQRYPLTYPIGYPRTPAHKRTSARFEVTFAIAHDDLFRELDLLKAKNIILSTNIPLRQDGLPYASWKGREPDDPSVALYFVWNKQPYVFACDRWNKVKDNLRAIGLTIAAIRGMERWGATQLKQAFAGYQALPPVPDWRSILGLGSNPTDDEIKAAYRRLSLEHHPDAGGSREEWEKISQAYSEARNYVRV